MTALQTRIDEVKKNFPHLTCYVVAENDPSGVGLFYRNTTEAQAFAQQMEEYAEKTWDVPGCWNKEFWKEKPRGWKVHEI